MVLVQMMEPLGRRLVMRACSSSSGMVSTWPRAKARIFSPAVAILAAMPPMRTSMISKPLGLLVDSHSLRHTTRRVSSASTVAGMPSARAAACSRLRLRTASPACSCHTHFSARALARAV